MENSLSITKDMGEYYIYLRGNSNLIAKGYENFWTKKVAIETTMDPRCRVECFIADPTLSITG